MSQCAFISNEFLYEIGWRKVAVFFQSTDLCKNVQEQVLVSVALNKMFLGMTSSIFILIIL